MSFPHCGSCNAIHFLGEITDSFSIDGRGTAIVVAVLDRKYKIKVGDTIELRSQGGATHQTKVAGVSLFDGVNPEARVEPVAILVSDEVPSAFVERGIGAWMAGNSRQLDRLP